jgi:hypothetical protein
MPLRELLVTTMLAGAAGNTNGAPTGIPSLAALSPPGFIPIETCPPMPSGGASDCHGWELPQLDGMVRGDNATTCFHLGCCYSLDKATGRDVCRASSPATAEIAARSTEWFNANQPLPSLTGLLTPGVPAGVPDVAPP